MAEEWILCPICSCKTRNKRIEDTLLINYHLYCPKCKKKTLINKRFTYNRHQRARRKDAEPMNL